jgi:hypothetical protein
MIRDSVREQRGEPHAIPHGKKVVDHRFVRVHPDLTYTERHLKLFVDPYGVTMGQKVDSFFFLLLLIEGLEGGELERVERCIVEGLF